MKATTKKSQCQRLLAYLKRHKKGITTMEAFRELGICCLHKRIAELEESLHYCKRKNTHYSVIVTRTWITLPSGTRVIRYSLSR